MVVYLYFFMNVVYDAHWKRHIDNFQVIMQGVGLFLLPLPTLVNLVHGEEPGSADAATFIPEPTGPKVYGYIRGTGLD